MDAETLKRVLSLLSDRVPGLMALHWEPACCIAATKIGVEVLKRLKVRALPIVSRVMILNPTLQRRLEAFQEANDGKLPSDEELAAMSKDPGGCWSVGVGYGDAPRGAFSGHLIVGIPRPDSWYGLDLSLGQGRRLNRGIDIPDGFWFQLPSGFFTPGAIAGCKLPMGSGLLYDCPADAAFRGAWQKSPDWMRTTRTQKIVNEIVRNIQEVIL